MSEVKKENKTKKTTTKKETKKEKIIEEKKITTKKASEKKVVKKENKKEKILLNDKDQVCYRSLTKVVKILAKIARICLMIFVPFIFLTMILIPIVFNKFEISANIIKFDDVNLIVNEDKLTVKFGDSVHVLKCDAKKLDDITTFLTDNSKSSIITFLELSLLLFAIILILNIYLFSYIEKLFDNFTKKDTPFIEENSKYIFKVIILMGAIKFISVCLSFADISFVKFETFNIIEILIVVVVYFIFKYAVCMQNKIDTKISD